MVEHFGWHRGEGCVRLDIGEVLGATREASRLMRCNAAASNVPDSWSLLTHLMNTARRPPALLGRSGQWRSACLSRDRDGGTDAAGQQGRDRSAGSPRAARGPRLRPGLHYSGADAWEQ